MRIRIIKVTTIREFAIKHGRVSLFENWIHVVKNVSASKLEDFTTTFSNADLLGKSSHRICFNIGGNNYRLIAQVSFKKTSTILYICWIGTHAEYDKLCEKGDQYTVWKY